MNHWDAVARYNAEEALDNIGRFLPFQIKESLISLYISTHYKNRDSIKVIREYADEAKRCLNLPGDIKAYLDAGTAIRMKRRGVKASKAWMVEQADNAKRALSVLPVPFYKLDCKEKRRLVADQLANHASVYLSGMQKNCFDYKACALELIDKSTVMHWPFTFVPNFSKANDDDYWLGVIARLIDTDWWNRKITTAYHRAYEDARRACGMVAPESGYAYCSKGQLSQFKAKLAEQDEWLKNTVMRDAEGNEISLKDIYQASVANPEIRRAELMTRINGFQELAEEKGYNGLFLTMTTPSRFHRKTKRGKYWIDNPKYDGSTVRDGQQWLCKRWSLIRSAMNDANIDLFGFRVAEPHADGTVHWHMLTFVPPVFTVQVEQICRRYMHLSSVGDIRKLARGCQTTKQDRAELSTEKAKRARFDCKAIDKAAGCAAAYIAKYIAKNIDANGLDNAVDFETGKKNMVHAALAVRAWASVHGIRQFQQIGGAPVTVWRELRRLTDKVQSPKLEAMRVAAGLRGDDEALPDYAEYCRLNKYGCVKLLKVPAENQYGEETTKIMGLEGLGLMLITHDKEWEIARKGASDTAEGGISRINENNCRTAKPEGKSLPPSARLALLDIEYDRKECSYFDELYDFG